MLTCIEQSTTLNKSFSAESISTTFLINTINLVYDPLYYN